MAQTTVPLSTPNEQPTRRGLIGRLAAVGAIGATPALASALAVDPHPEWEREMCDVYDHWMNAIDVSDAVVAEAIDAYWELWVAIVETKPRTMSGLAAQLRTIVHGNDICDPMDEREEGILRRVADVLDSVGGRA
ncbi:MAG: hypothetical protein WAS21_03680 [Geminicoccaceae bacterium]